MEKLIMCRICLSRTNKSISVFSHKIIWDRNVKLSDMIMACAPLEVKTDDSLPKLICDLCFKHLQVAFLFRIRALQANETLMHCVKEKTEPPAKLLSEIFPISSIQDDYESHCFNLEEMLAMMETNSKARNTVSKTDKKNDTLDVQIIKSEPGGMDVRQDVQNEIVQPEKVEQQPNFHLKHQKLVQKILQQKKQQQEEQQPKQQEQILLLQQDQEQVLVLQQQQETLPVVNVSSSVVTSSLLKPEIQLPKQNLIPNIIIPNTSNTLAPILLQQNCSVDTIQLAAVSTPETSERSSEINNAYIIIPYNDSQRQANIHTVTSNSLLASSNPNTIRIENGVIKAVSTIKSTVLSNAKQESAKKKDFTNRNRAKGIAESSETGRLEPQVLELKKVRKLCANKKSVSDGDISSSPPAKRLKSQLFTISNSTIPSAAAVNVSSSETSNSMLDCIVID